MDIDKIGHYGHVLTEINVLGGRGFEEVSMRSFT
jgi:hypothetical protein